MPKQDLFSLEISRPRVRVIGGGLAGCEASLLLADSGVEVDLYEMRPVRETEAHKTAGLAELVCSNSFKSLSLATGPGILKAEMDLFDSSSLKAARVAAVGAGEALAVDRDVFSAALTKRVEAHPRIHIHREEITSLANSEEEPLTIVATGPLTSPVLAESIQKISGEAEFYFYDAISPILATNSVDWSIAFRANRHDKPGRQMEGASGSANQEGDYINCPMNRDEYNAFVAAIASAERLEPKNFERVVHFEGCMPIEEMVDRGPDTLRFGPMRPIGLTDPRTGRRPWAAVQLRTENTEGTMLNLVGFQTKMKYGEQKRVLTMIPGLANAEFLRFGSMHRNAFVNAPKVLAPDLSLRAAPRIFLAGQVTGVEGYMESSSVGILAALSVLCRISGQEFLDPPRASAFGSLLSHLRNTESPDFQPMGINFGLFGEENFAPALEKLRAENPKAKKLPKQAKRELIGQVALENARGYEKEIWQRLTSGPLQDDKGSQSFERTTYAENSSHPSP